MSDESEDIASKSIGPDALASRLALEAATAAEARDYLRHQNDIARLQIDTLQKQDEYETSHLRWRRFNDQMKGAMQIMLVAIGALFVFAIGTALWSAAHDDGVVIEAFNVPPDMQARGLTGAAVSSLLLDRLTALQSQIDSARAPNSYAGSGDDIKVLIPDTGISISEAYRYLVGWLGNETHISGDVYRTTKGITVIVRTSGHPGASFDGNEDQLNALMDRAAEVVYGQTQPFRYAVHLLNHNRFDEADVVLSDLAMNGAALEKPWAYALWIYPALQRDDIPTAVMRAQKATLLDPDNLLAQMNLAQVEANAGHDEQELQADHAAQKATAAGGGKQIRPLARDAMEEEAESNIGEETGDYLAAVAQYDKEISGPDFNGSHWSAIYLKSADLAKWHDASASRRTLGNYADKSIFVLSDIGSGWNQTNLDFPQFQQFAAQGDWVAARKDLEQTLSVPEARGIGTRILVVRQTVPWLALAQAKTGDLALAWSEIGKTPLDCYPCLRVRGQIAGMRKDWRASSDWFARAVALAPSIPFAYTDWGAMLMARGDLDSAIAKFTLAHQKGPHFADPLEMWGEALIAKNRSDLALAKFAEADKYAPDWGRLHLKWGEALWWSGDRDGARKQFAAAAALDLTPAEKSELAKVDAHG